MSDQISRSQAMSLVPWDEWRPAVASLVRAMTTDAPNDVPNAVPMRVYAELYAARDEVQTQMMAYACGVRGWSNAQWMQWFRNGADALGMFRLTALQLIDRGRKGKTLLGGAGTREMARMYHEQCGLGQTTIKEDDALWTMIEHTDGVVDQRLADWLTVSGIASADWIAWVLPVLQGVVGSRPISGGSASMAYWDDNSPMEHGGVYTIPDPDKVESISMGSDTFGDRTSLIIDDVTCFVAGRESQNALRVAMRPIFEEAVPLNGYVSPPRVARAIVECGAVLYRLPDDGITPSAPSPEASAERQRVGLPNARVPFYGTSAYRAMTRDNEIAAALAQACDADVNSSFSEEE